MASGVKVSDNVKTEYQALKAKQEYGYIILKITDNYTLIDVCDKGDKITNIEENKARYDEFIGKLREAEQSGEGRYAFFDFHYEHGSQLKNKIQFIAWNPDTAAIKQKMLYASSRGAVSDALKEVKKFRQATDEDDISYDRLTKECNDADRA